MTWLAVSLLATALHPLERRGFEQLYNLDFRPAAETFQELARQEPSSPAGPHYLASLLWWEELTRRGAMAGETFQSGRYWTRTRREPVAPELQQSFADQVDESLRRSRARLAQNSKDPEALYFAGATESVVSGFEATLNHRYFAAYLAGRRARQHHERLLALDPTAADAYMVPGLFEYTLATLPRSAKFLAFLLGVRGSKEKGIEYLRRTATSGERARWDARLLLTVIDGREKRYQQALEAMKDFETHFPKNPLYPLEQGWIELQRKDWEAARRIFGEVLLRHDRGVANFDRLGRPLILLRLGESALYAGELATAVERFETALADPAGRPEIKAALYLRRGQAWDVRNERERAKADYLATIALNVDRSSLRAARRYLKSPYRLAR
jgi:hypothetical protein